MNLLEDRLSKERICQKLQPIFVLLAPAGNNAQGSLMHTEQSPAWLKDFL
jgi:hypothetical protein